MKQEYLMDQVARWRIDRMAFRKEAILLEDGTPFGKVMEPWQEEDFAALDSAQYRHAYLERPRGHAKTFDLATEAVAELMLGGQGERLFCAAADEDQARLLFEDVASKFQRNPLLRGCVKITQRDITVMATGSRLRILSSDAPTAYGLRPDWIAVDELAEWRRRELWDSLWTATGKRPTCRVMAISSAGWDFNSIAWEVRQIAEREADWYFSSRGQCASWVSAAWLEQQRRTLPPHVFARLHECRWVPGGGAFLSSEEVDSIFAAELPAGSGQVAIGLDLGLTRDAAVIAVVRRCRGTELVTVEILRTWLPQDGRKVELSDVEAEVIALAKKFGASVILDPWQAALMAQRLRGQGVRVTEYAFTTDSRRRLFSVLLDLIRIRRLRCRPHEQLRRELLALEVQETTAGWRVDHRPGQHDDHVIAVGLAAQELLTRPVAARAAWQVNEDLATEGYWLRI